MMETFCWIGLGLSIKGRCGLQSDLVGGLLFELRRKKLTERYEK